MRALSSTAQMAAASAFVTLALIGLPALADQATVETGAVFGSIETIDVYHAQNLIANFRRPGASTEFSNTSIDRSAFDFAGFITDTCFHPSASDRGQCQAKYGTYSDFRAILLDGTLAHLLVAFNVIAHEDIGIIVTVIDQVQGKARMDAEPRDRTPTEAVQQKLDSRTEQVWKICSARYIADDAQKSCFQRNRRIITQKNILITSERVY